MGPEGGSRGHPPLERPRAWLLYRLPWQQPAARHDDCQLTAVCSNTQLLAHAPCRITILAHVLIRRVCRHPPPAGLPLQPSATSKATAQMADIRKEHHLTCSRHVPSRQQGSSNLAHLLHLEAAPHLPGLRRLLTAGLPRLAMSSASSKRPSLHPPRQPCSSPAHSAASGLGRGSSLSDPAQHNRARTTPQASITFTACISPTLHVHPSSHCMG